MLFTNSAVLTTLFLCAPTFRQSAFPDSKTFHIQGTIADPNGGAMPGVTVTFASEKVAKTVVVNSSGIYQADLQFGEYGMVVMPLGRYHGFSGYHRSFRVEASSAVTFNVTLFPLQGSCDIVVNGPGNPASPDAQETTKDFCGGEDSFSIPFAGRSMDLYIRFRSRRRSASSSSYSGWKGPQYDEPVFITYNLSTLFADHIAYDASNRTLHASGHVHFDNQANATVLSDSATVKIGDGRLIQLH